MCCFLSYHTYIMIENKWYDVTDFLKIHPGGESILKKYHKKDVTEKFYSIKKHSNYIKALEQFLIEDKILLEKLNKNKIF
jgi:cytochrome b involved in lipid metabolism